jgi:hypothetical protein
VKGRGEGREGEGRVGNGRAGKGRGMLHITSKGDGRPGQV